MNRGFVLLFVIGISCEVLGAIGGTSARKLFLSIKASVEKGSIESVLAVFRENQEYNRDKLLNRNEIRSIASMFDNEVMSELAENIGIYVRLRHDSEGDGGLSEGDLILLSRLLGDGIILEQIRNALFEESKSNSAE